MTDINIIKISAEENLKECFHIRTTVFVNEQNVPLPEEIDGLDGEADHYLLSVDGIATATARVRYMAHVAKIERVAVLKSYRGLRLGQRLMEFIITEIGKNPDLKTMKLGAQLHAITFYEKLGFRSYGDKYFDANIRHIWMKREI